MSRDKSNFCIVPNSMARDRNLSYSAKGLLAELISHGRNWEIKVDWLIKKYNGRKTEIRNALKELTRSGYLTRNNPIDKNTGKFCGSKYSLNWVLVDNLMSNPKAGKTELRKSRSSKSPRAGKPEPPENGISIKEERGIRNTEIKRKEHQQEEPAAAAVAGCKIDYFFHDLMEDQEWLLNFLNTTIGDNRLGMPQIKQLLNSFKEFSLQVNCVYAGISDVKKHFSNWFNKLRREDLLVQKIREQNAKQRLVKNDAKRLIEQINNVLAKYDNRLFRNPEDAIYVLSLLPEKIREMKELKKLIDDASIHEAVSTSIREAERLQSKLKRVRSEGNLHLICQSLSSYRPK